MARAAARGEAREAPAARPANLRSICFQLAKDLRTALDRDLAPLGLRTQQAAVLLRCCRNPGMSPGRLAAAVSTDSAGATGLIDQLEKCGLVTRCASPVDRRGVLVEATEAGRDLAPRLRDLFQQINDVLLAGFSPAEAIRLEAMLRRLHANVEQRLAETDEPDLVPRRPRPTRRGPARKRLPGNVPSLRDRGDHQA